MKARPGRRGLGLRLARQLLLVQLELLADGARHVRPARHALREFDGIFEARFRLALDSGELDAGADPVLLSRIASALLHSLALRLRAGDKRAELAATAAAGIRLICGPQP